MTGKDDNTRLLAGTLPARPEDDAEAVVAEEPPSLFGNQWKTLAGHGGPDWFDQAPPQRRWLLALPADKSEAGEGVTGVLPLGKVGMLAAAGAAGKTMALVQLALAVACEREWLDTYDAPNPGHVLLALGEEDLEEVRRRMYAAGRVMRLTDAQQRLASERIIVMPLAGTRLALTDEQRAPTQVLEELRARLDAHPHDWRLIALDPLSRFAGVDAEIDNHAATAFVETLESLTQTKGSPTLLVAHHTNKSSRGPDGEASTAIAARGASALTDGARWVANLEPDRSMPDRVRLTITKSNYTPRVAPLNLIRCEGGALRAETGHEREYREQNKREPRAARQENGQPGAVTDEDY